MTRDHGRDALERASTEAGVVEALRAGAARLGVLPSELVMLGDGYSTALLEGAQSDRSELRCGTVAFISGLLQGLELVSRSGRPTRTLDGALGAVRRRGHQSVIAANCDLAAVAEAELELADSILNSFDLRRRASPELRRALPHLFEVGLAVGFAGVCDADERQ